MVETLNKLISHTESALKIPIRQEELLYNDEHLQRIIAMLTNGVILSADIAHVDPLQLSKITFHKNLLATKYMQSYVFFIIWQKWWIRVCQRLKAKLNYYAP